MDTHSTHSPKPLDRYLSVIDVWAMAFGCMVGWGVFAMPGTTFLPVAGPLGTMLSMLIGMVISDHRFSERHRAVLYHSDTVLRRGAKRHTLHGIRANHLSGRDAGIRTGACGNRHSLCGGKAGAAADQYRAGDCYVRRDYPDSRILPAACLCQRRAACLRNLGRQ